MNGALDILKKLFEINGAPEFLLRGLLAVICGSIIGLERQWTRHPAGITSILVCIGGYFFTAFSFIFQNDANLENIRDITRVAAQVVAGIGFLGAGVIMRQGGNIKGLNTAATIWCSGSVGVLCAWGSMWRPIIATIVILIVNVTMSPIAVRIKNHRMGQVEKQEKQGLIRIICEPEKEFYIRSRLMQMMAAESIVLHNLQTSDSDGKTKIKATVVCEEIQESVLEKIISLLSIEKGVISAGWFEL